MRTYEKLALRHEQELLSTLQPKQKLQAKKKVVWTINSQDVRYEMIAVGRTPNGIEVEEWSNPPELSLAALQANDICEAGDSQANVGKYRIITKCFTSQSEKFDAIRIHYDNVQDRVKTFSSTTLLYNHYSKLWKGLVLHQLCWY